MDKLIDVGLQYGFIGVIAVILFINMVKQNNMLFNKMTEIIENNTKAMVQLQEIVKQHFKESDV